MYEYSNKQLIKKFTKKRMSIRAFGAEAGIPAATIHKALSEEQFNLNISTLVQLCNALDVCPKSLFVLKAENE